MSLVSSSKSDTNCLVDIVLFQRTVLFWITWRYYLEVQSNLIFGMFAGQSLILIPNIITINPEDPSMLIQPDLIRGRR